MSDTPGFVIDPEATVDNMFVPTEQTTDQPQAENASAEQTVVTLSSPDAAGQRFAFRANHRDVEVTGQELMRLAQKGEGYDQLAGELGELRKSAPNAEAWQSFQEAMKQNPGAALSAYAQQYGLVVGSLSADGSGFNPVDMTAAPATPPPGQASQATSNPELAELKELVTLQSQALTQLMNERQTTSVAQTLGATPQETQAANTIIQERGLKPTDFDLALSMVRSQSGTPVPAQQQQVPGRLDITPSLDEMSGQEAVNALLAGMKAGNPTLGGSHAVGGATQATKSFEEMTGDEVVDATWAQWKSDVGIR